MLRLMALNKLAPRSNRGGATKRTIAAALPNFTPRTSPVHDDNNNNNNDNDNNDNINNNDKNSNTTSNRNRNDTPPLAPWRAGGETGGRYSIL